MEIVLGKKKFKGVSYFLMTMAGDVIIKNEITADEFDEIMDKASVCQFRSEKLIGALTMYTFDLYDNLGNINGKLVKCTKHEKTELKADK